MLVKYRGIYNRVVKNKYIDSFIKLTRFKKLVYYYPSKLLEWKHLENVTIFMFFMPSHCGTPTHKET